MEIIYKAIDGTEFDSEKECVKHETITKLIKDCFGETGRTGTIHTCLEDIMDFIKDNKDAIIGLFAEHSVQQNVIDWDEVPTGTVIEVSDDREKWVKRSYACPDKANSCFKAYIEDTVSTVERWKYARLIK